MYEMSPIEIVHVSGPIIRHLWLFSYVYCTGCPATLGGHAKMAVSIMQKGSAMLLFIGARSAWIIFFQASVIFL